MFEDITNWMEGHYFPCWYHQLFGIDCPFCGFQRSVVALLRGQVWDSFVLFPPLVFFVITLIYGLYRWFRYKKEGNWRDTAYRIMLWTDLGVLMTNCIVKNIIHFI